MDADGRAPARPGAGTARRARLRFDGWIAGLGTSSGTRVVLGHWPGSPFGPFSDVMLERPDGHRLLLAPSPEIARFVAATYVLDDVQVVPVRVHVAGAEWNVTAAALTLRFVTGRRGPLGHLLGAVPAALSARPAWAAVLAAPARLLGLRTRGSARDGRREWYSAQDLRRITDAAVTYEGEDLGSLTPVEPPVRFGFGSTPRRPCVVRVTTTVALRATG